MASADPQQPPRHPFAGDLTDDEIAEAYHRCTEEEMVTCGVCRTTFPLDSYYNEERPGPVSVCPPFGLCHVCVAAGRGTSIMRIGLG